MHDDSLYEKKKKKNNRKTGLARFIVTSVEVVHFSFGFTARGRTFTRVLVPRAVPDVGANGLRGGPGRFAPGLIDSDCSPGFIDTSVGVFRDGLATPTWTFTRVFLPLAVRSLGASGLRGGLGRKSCTLGVADPLVVLVEASPGVGAYNGGRTTRGWAFHLLVPPMWVKVCVRV